MAVCLFGPPYMEAAELLKSGIVNCEQVYQAFRPFESDGVSKRVDNAGYLILNGASTKKGGSED
jgi:hypothetical protein